MAEGLATFSVVFVLVLIVAGIVRLKRTKTVIVTDFQRGVRFRNGAFRDELGPGSYGIDSLKEQVLIMDLRPRPVLLERQGYQDAMQSPSIVSIAGELHVADAHLAATKLKDPLNDTFPLVREALLRCASQKITDESANGRQELAEGITRVVNEQLANVGMRIANVEITELWSRPGQTSVAATAN